MFTRSDLATLLADRPTLAVSIFLPTHVRGSEVRQGPILLKNLTTRAHDDLMTAGISPADAETLLAPARALIDNYPFWQHQDQGLALFLNGGAAHRYKVPIPLAEQVVVGPGFHIRPLLPILAADGAYRVLTITAGKVRLFEASRFAITEVENTGLPDNLGDELGDPDYENKVLAGVIEGNPEAMDSHQLHDATYRVMRQRLDTGRTQASERVQALLGSGDPRATTVTDEVVRAAYQGRVDTVLLVERATAWGRYDEATDQIIDGHDVQAGDLLETASVQTLLHGGIVHLLTDTQMPGPIAAAAILRY